MNNELDNNNPVINTNNQMISPNINTNNDSNMNNPFSNQDTQANQPWINQFNYAESQMTNNSPDNFAATSNPFDIKNNNQGTANPSTTYVDILKKEGVNVVENHQKFIQESNKFNETSISDLNIEGNYNTPQMIDYRNDPNVMKNLSQVNEKKTIKLTSELKAVILIVFILFIFVIVMPFIFDTIKNIN